MPHGRIIAVEALDAQNEEALIGITDLLSVQTPNGAVLFTAGRGGGWVTAFEIGSIAGDAQVRSTWQIPAGWLQLEATDMVHRGGAGADEVLLAGLNSAQMLAVQLEDTSSLSAFDGTRTHTASGTDLGGVAQITALDDQGATLGGLRAGGLVQAQFSATGQASVTQITLTGDLVGAQATALDSMVIGGTTYAVAAFGAQNTLSLLTGTEGGALSVRASAVADPRVAFTQPSDAEIIEVDGVIYAIAASSGTGSLTVFQVNPTTGAMTAVDHVLDTRDTRFADVSFLKSISHDGATYLVAAGSDQGLTLLTVLPGGQLHVLDSLEGSFDLPLDSITDIELAITGDTLRIWASTMAAPYLSEFSVDLSTQGARLFATAGGGALNGTAGSDTLWGGAGADQLSGGAGDDILYDGAGADVLEGGAGADTFVFRPDEANDRITGFERGIDRIDLTQRAGDQADLGDVQVTVRSWGAELDYDGERISVYSADGDPLRADDFGLPAFVTDLDRVSLAPMIEYPATDGGSSGSGSGSGGSGSGSGSSGGGSSGSGSSGSGSGSGGGVTPVAAFATNNDDLLMGGTGNDTLDGMRGDDRIAGQDGADMIWGRGGDDTLVGGDGADQLQGGDGDDLIYGDSSSELDWI